MISTTRWSILFVAIITLSACSTTIVRHPVPKAQASLATIPNMPKQVRIWGDVTFPQSWIDASIERLKKEDQARPVDINHLPPAHILALSGGADDGAFGAGLLVGWSSSNQRPEFQYVTGISTGALIAPFAYLGSDYDWVLREIYTQYSTEDLVTLRSFLSIPFADSAADTAPLSKLIDKYVTQDILDAIAKEYKKGRNLVIGTTHLDAQRPMLWNMGLIAATDSPNSLALFRQVMMASSALPAIFPPMYIEVELNGQIYDEMHVDGGTVAQLIVFPPGLDSKKQLEKLNIKRERHLYLIRNARLEPQWTEVEPKLVSIGDRSISTLIKSQGKNDLYEIWEMSQRQGMKYHLASIPNNFTEISQESFDSDYMKKLFDHAFSMSEKGYPWKNKPPKIINSFK